MWREQQQRVFYFNTGFVTNYIQLFDQADWKFHSIERSQLFVLEKKLLFHCHHCKTSAKLHKITALRFMFLKIHNIQAASFHWKGRKNSNELKEKKKQFWNRDVFCLLMTFYREIGNNLCIRKMLSNKFTQRKKYSTDL